jgi:hypothetical protein
MSAVVRPQEESFEPLMAADLDEVVKIESAVYRFPWTLGNFQDSLRAAEPERGGRLPAPWLWLADARLDG